MVLEPFLSMRSSETGFLALFCLSFFIENDASEQHKQILKLEMSDIQLLKSKLVKKQITVADGLHFVKTSTLVSSNLHVLINSNVHTFVSQFLDDYVPTVEGKLAAEIISILNSEDIEAPGMVDQITTESPDKLIESVLPILNAFNSATTDKNVCLDKESCSLIFQTLKSLVELFKSKEVKAIVQSIPETTLEKATRELCFYIKQHLMGRSMIIYNYVLF